MPDRGEGRAEPPEARSGRERLRRVFFPVGRRRRAAEIFGTLFKMQYKFFTIPAFAPDEMKEELNRFLRSQTICSVKKELVVMESMAHWVFCVEYAENTPPRRDAGRERVDYKQVLSENDFVVFSRLRDLRRKLAESEGIPVYAICTNEQLAEMAKQRISSVDDLRRIPGIGEAKAEKYGEHFVRMLQQESAPPEANP